MPDDIRTELRVQMLRQKRTPKWVAHAAGTSSAAVCKVLSGDTISPRLALGFEIALNVPANYILRRQAEEQMSAKLNRQFDKLEALRGTEE